MNREDITRYIRPEDIPLVDQSILEPIVTKVAKDMNESHPEQSVEEWIETLQRALLRGDLLIVIDDTNRRLGLVPTDEPPFSALADASATGAPHPAAADPLNLRKWETGQDSDEDPPTGEAP